MTRQTKTGSKDGPKTGSKGSSSSNTPLPSRSQSPAKDASDDLADKLRNLKVDEGAEDPLKSTDSRKNQGEGSHAIAAVASATSDSSPIDGKGKGKSNTRTEEWTPALDVYIKASMFERMGNLSSALQYYREAHRMNADVEAEYRRYLPLHKNDNSLATSVVSKDQNIDESFFTYYQGIQGDEDLVPNPHNGGTLLLDSLPPLSKLTFHPQSDKKPQPLSQLPSELLTHVLKFVILKQFPMLVNVSLVCRKFYVLTREKSLWRYICERIHRPSRPFLALERELEVEYGDDWMKMFVQKARIRNDGVFISRVNYVRMGISEMNFSSPVHLVTYFRFLRFMTDGSCILVTSPVEPAQVVKALHHESKLKGLMTGHYFLGSGGRVLIELRDADRPRTLFKCVLLVKSTRYAQQNKLQWESYQSIRENGVTNFPLSQLRSFMFSKVKSFLDEIK